MQIEKLQGGTVIQVKQDRLAVNIYAGDPGIRVGSPGTLLGNVGVGVQINEVSKLQFGNPEATLVKVIFRQIDQEMFLVIGAANKTGPDVYELKFDTSTKAPIIRGLKLLFKDAEIALRRDRWYEMKTKIVHDETVGYAVAANWTHAKTRPRIKGDAEDQAAGEEAEPAKPEENAPAEAKQNLSAKAAKGKATSKGAAKAQSKAPKEQPAPEKAAPDTPEEKVPAEGL